MFALDPASLGAVQLSARALIFQSATAARECFQLD